MESEGYGGRGARHYGERELAGVLTTDAPMTDERAGEARARARARRWVTTPFGMLNVTGATDTHGGAA